MEKDVYYDGLQNKNGPMIYIGRNHLENVS
jgi:hypothetical protein